MEFGQNSPCFGCRKRCEACHSNCAEYSAWKEFVTDIRLKASTEKTLSYYFSRRDTTRLSTNSVRKGDY